MSVVAARELEEDARKYAGEAIRLDSQGAHGMAIQMYQKAISTLIKLVHLYPDYKLNRHYMERAGLYQERVKAIQQAHGLATSRYAKRRIFLLHAGRHSGRQHRRRRKRQWQRKR